MSVREFVAHQHCLQTVWGARRREHLQVPSLHPTPLVCASSLH